MTDKRTNKIKGLIDKIFGGLNMSWRNVILFAVNIAIITGLALIVPAFRGTSFERIGVHFEAWILFAVIIMANCKTPKESALKVFVFFLVSQPLIYLLQVPFSSMGWRIFSYYYYWFILTIATLPVAYAGWYINKRNWISVAIFIPVIVFLTFIMFDCFQQCYNSFPHFLFAALFCLFQIVIYIIEFMPQRLMKLAAVLSVIITVGILLIRSPRVDVSFITNLPEEVVLTDNAEVTVEDDSIIQVTIESTGDNSRIKVHGTKIGQTFFTIKDGNKEYRFYVSVYRDEGIKINISQVN